MFESKITTIIGFFILIILITAMLPTIANMTLGINTSNQQYSNVTGAAKVLTTLTPIVYVLLPVFAGLALFGIIGKKSK